MRSGREHHRGHRARSGAARLTAARLTAALCAAAALASCTSPEPTDPAAGPTSPPTSSSAPSAEAEPGDPTRSRAGDGARDGAREGADPSVRQPLVLVTHATVPRLRLTLDEANELLSEDRDGTTARGPGRVLVARGLPGGPRAEQSPTPAAVVRAVRRERGLVGAVPAGAVDATVRTAVVAGIDPLRQPDRYRPTTPVRGRGPDAGAVVRLSVVGDIMLTRGVTDPAGALAPLAPRLRRADLTVGNLESTLSRAGAPTQGSDSFGADPGVVGPLRRSGLDALSLANNHAGDYGEPAMLTTVQRLRAAGLRPFGVGADRREAGRPVVLTRDGTRFGFLGFNAIGETPRATQDAAGALSVRMPPRTGPLQESDLRQVTARVEDLARRVDVVVVLPHWGTQYTHRPEPVQRVVARRLADAGADLVVGGHPHWVQGLDLVGSSVVAHSLGNFVFDMDFMTRTLQGVVLETTWWGDDLKAVDLVPYRMDASFAPRPASPGEARQILSDVWSTSTGPFRVP